MFTLIASEPLSLTISPLAFHVQHAHEMRLAHKQNETNADVCAIRVGVRAREMEFMKSFSIRNFIVGKQSNDVRRILFCISRPPRRKRREKMWKPQQIAPHPITHRAPFNHRTVHREKNIVFDGTCNAESLAVF